MTSMHRPLPRLVAIACILCACDPGAASLTSGVVRRDSAGVELIVSTAPAWSRDSAWTVVDTPFFDVGGRPGSDFENVVSVVRTPAGAIAAADGGDQRIRVFNAAGEVVRILGAKGSGPGEFQALQWMTYAADSLLAYDLVLRRLTLFGASGRVRTAALEPGSALYTSPVGRFRNGDLLVVSGGATFPFPGASGSVRRDSARLFRYDADGHLRDTLAAVAWSESYGLALGSNGRRFMAPMPRPFARRTSVAVLGEGFVVAEGGAFEVNEFDKSGRLTRSLRRPQQGAPVTPEAIRAFIDARRAEPRERGLQGALDSVLVSSLERAPFPKVMPAVERLLLDEAGNIWVEWYGIRRDEPRTWSVFDGSGRWLGNVATPARLDVEYIARDALYGVWTRGDDVPRVRGYRLRKP